MYRLGNVCINTCHQPALLINCCIFHVMSLTFIHHPSRDTHSFLPKFWILLSYQTTEIPDLTYISRGFQWVARIFYFHYWWQPSSSLLNTNQSINRHCQSIFHIWFSKEWLTIKIIIFTRWFMTSLPLLL
jgi:hypothetical protein